MRSTEARKCQTKKKENNANCAEFMMAHITNLVGIIQLSQNECVKLRNARE